MLRSLHVLLLPCLLLTSCGDEPEPAAGSRTTVEVPLDLGGEGGTPTAIPASASASKQERAVPAPAASAKDRDAATALDAWHRRATASRAGDGGTDPAAATFAQLQRALTGDASAVQAQWAQKAPAALGEAFARLAAGFAKEGTAGLERALPAAADANPAHLVFNELLAVRSLELQEIERAGLALGRLLQGAIAAGYPRERILAWAPLAVAIGEGIGKTLASSEYLVASGDSYWKICSVLRKNGQPIQHGWIKLFNRRRNDNLGAGEKLRIPSVPLRVEAWRQLRLTAVFAGALPVRLYASSSGKPETPTPLGEFTLQICEKEPIYYPPGATPIPYQNPDNPLGERWLGFAEDRQYGLHGTNSENTIGSFETGGCIRLHNADVTELFDLVGPGARVRLNP